MKLPGIFERFRAAALGKNHDGYPLTDSPQKGLPIGQSDFETIIRENYFYVDKTPLIREITKQGLVLLIPRPRRFGKTLNMNMLRVFFEQSETNKADLFKDLAVAQDREMMALQGRYPVIFLSFLNKAAKAEDCLEDLRSRIADEFKRHADVLLDGLNKWDRDFYEGVIEFRASDNDYQNALKKLSGFLRQHYQSKVIVLIDEYDTPMLAAHEGGYLDEVLPFWRGVLSQVFKDNPDLEKGVLTGIMRIAKESVFSGLNNLNVFSFLQTPFSDKFGLTEAEVEHVLGDYDLASSLEDVRTWYNGYTVGPHRIYNPWSIIHFLKNRQLGSYWIQTGGNDIIKRLVQRGNSKLPDVLGNLLHGGSVSCDLKENIAFEDIRDDIDLVLSFLVFTGYLAVDEKPPVGETRVNLRIPNKEVEDFFRTTFNSWLKQATKLDSLRGLLNELTNGSLEAFETHLQELVKQMMSYHDPAGEDPERVYHAFVLGLLAHLRDGYEVKSNRESGVGRYDIALFPKNHGQTGVILEFKKIKEQSPESALKEALDQVDEMDYAQEFRERGLNHIRKVAVAFKAKKVWSRGLDSSLNR